MASPSSLPSRFCAFALKKRNRFNAKAQRKGEKPVSYLDENKLSSLIDNAAIEVLQELGGPVLLPPFLPSRLRAFALKKADSI